MHDERLKPALEPTATLPEPVWQRGRRFFVSIGVKRCDASPKTGEPKAEVGVFRDIPRVPATDFAQDTCPEMRY
jgi:hypothetical protein